MINPWYCRSNEYGNPDETEGVGKGVAGEPAGVIELFARFPEGPGPLINVGIIEEIANRTTRPTPTAARTLNVCCGFGVVITGLTGESTVGGAYEASAAILFFGGGGGGGGGMLATIA